MTTAVAVPSIGERMLVTYARRFPVRRGKIRVVDALWRLASRGADTRRTARLKYAGFRVPCDISEMLQRQFYFFGTYALEEDILATWQQSSVGAHVVFDVGANAGIFSLAAMAVSPDAVVHAFEPTPEIADRLRETAAMNGLAQLHVHQVAVALRSGSGTLMRFRGERNDNEGMNYLGDGSAGGGERVDTISVDQFCAERGIDRIDLLKLDIQGGELEALAGARSMILAGRIGTIFTELNWAAGDPASCPATQSVALLESAGYKFAVPGRRLEWQSSGDWIRRHWNIVARRFPI